MQANLHVLQDFKVARTRAVGRAHLKDNMTRGACQRTFAGTCTDDSSVRQLCIGSHHVVP